MNKLLEGQTGLIIILAAIVGAVLIFRPNLEQLPAPANRIAIQQKEVPKQIAISPPKASASANAVALEKAMLSENIMIANGLTSVPVAIEGNKLSVTITPKPEAQWCKTGDFDLLKAISPNVKDKIITLSLESTRKNGVKKVQTYSLGELLAGKPVTFEIPNKNGAYGLFLCSDQSKTGVCTKKNPVSPKIWSSGESQMKKLATDKVFYFQLLQVKDGTLSIIPSENWGKNNVAELKDQLAGFMGKDVSALDRMDKIVGILRPVPARVAGEAIEIPLPYNDMRCNAH